MNLLEYASFGLAFLSCLLYGNSVRQGASVGIVSAVLFLFWGTINDVMAAVLCNVGFLVINSFNLYRSFKGAGINNR